ncbi:MAG TPA: hypothetical protein VK737_09875 [Opitutales bacterium]|jgi:hypothetical protein|nr:hypothetical protein [Opitutales bacterium]
MIVILDNKRHLTLPMALGPAKPGERFEANFDAEEDAFVFRRIAAKPNWLEILKQCPVPMNDLPPRRREFPRRRKR